VTRTSHGSAERARSLPRPIAILWRALKVELLLYASTARAIARRPAVPRGAEGFGYHRQTLSVLVIFAVLSAVELVVVDLIVHRWPTIRLPLLILGIWGVLWMVGLICNHLVRPHTVGPAGIRVRNGLDLDLALPWGVVDSVALRMVTVEPKTPRLTSDDDGTTLSIRVSEATNVEIDLLAPTRARLPGRSPKGGLHEIVRVRLWADDPDAFLAAARRHITS
jgi:hypothetical protein